MIVQAGAQFAASFGVVSVKAEAAVFAAATSFGGRKQSRSTTSNVLLSSERTTEWRSIRSFFHLPVVDVVVFGAFAWCCEVSECVAKLSKPTNRLIAAVAAGCQCLIPVYSSSLRRVWC